MTQTSSGKNVARWVLFVPAAIIGSLLFGAFVAVLFHVGLSRFAPPGDLWRETFMFTASHFAFGASFVYIGCYVAPRENRRGVAIVLAGTALVMSGAMFTLLLIAKMWGSMYKYVVMDASAVVMALSILKGQVSSLNEAQIPQQDESTVSSEGAPSEEP